MQSIHFQELSQIQKQLLAAAEEAMKTSYSPYSDFSVGAALLTDQGEIVSASNVENASYTCGICAETAAVVKANSAGQRKFQAIAVIGGKKGDPVFPCGKCRQVLYEFSQVGGTDLEVILSDAKKNSVVLTSVSELLPNAFGPSDLGVNPEKYRHK